MYVVLAERAIEIYENDKVYLVLTVLKGVKTTTIKTITSIAGVQQAKAVQAHDRSGHLLQRTQ